MAVFLAFQRITLGYDFICLSSKHLKVSFEFQACLILVMVPFFSLCASRWMSRLWNSVIAPRVQEAILSRSSLKRPAALGQAAVKKSPSQGQQAVVKAALSILLNKAVLHGCPLPRAGEIQ